MSQIEQNFRAFLSQRPEIEKCQQEGLVNRRSLARYLIRHRLAAPSQTEAVIAMLRRFPFRESQKENNELFQEMRIGIRDNILILDFGKNRDLIQKLQKLIVHTDYDKGDTLKIVVGSASIKVFIDQEKEGKLKDIFDLFKPKSRLRNVSEISLLFPEKALNARGILSTLTRELALNDIVITEFLTATPELLIYVREEYVLKAYEILKRFQKIR